MTNPEEAEAEQRRGATQWREECLGWVDRGESQVVNRHEFHCSPAAHLNFDPLYLFVLSSEK